MKTELFINNTNVDLYKDEGIKFIFSIADVKNIGGRNTTYSKSLSIPGTASNNSLFNYIFDISSDHNFNPNKKASAYILVDSILVIDGYLQLISIDYDLKSQEIIYNVVIYASNFDLYKNIGDKLVEDLDYSNVTYNFTQSEIENSWTSSYVLNTREYVVPLIDYGYGWQQNRISDQNSPILNTQLYPATYVKGLIDRIIKDAGYTYTSNFLTSEFFKRLCLPVYSVAKQNAKVQIDLDLTISADTSNGPNYIGYNIELQRYKDGNWNTEVLYNSGSNFLASGAVVRIEDSKQFFTSPGEKWRVHTSAVGASYLHLTLCRNGTLKFTYPSPISGNTYVGNPFFSFSIQGGTYLVWPFHEDSVLPFYDPYNTWDNTGGIWEHTVPNLNYGVYLPKNIKQIDLLKSIISMFNLYIDIDKNNNKNLIIEPRDDYYRLNTRILDWSEKIDISKPIKEELLSELQSKSLLFTYKEDRDYLNADYKNITKKIYGEYRTSFDNDFISGENSISLIVSPTPVQNITDSDTIIIPKIYKFDATNNTFEQTDGNLRILYNAGKTYVEPTEKYYINYSAGTYLNTSILTEIYPYVSTNDSYSASTLTLNWGDNQFEYFNSTGVTDNNLYNLYWSNYYKEISDKRSKLVTAYFNLTPLDISNFKFNDLIYVEALKNYFRINKIEYDALGDSISKVELISVVSVDGFISKGRVTNTIKKADGKGRIGINIGKNNISDFALSVGNGNTINSSNRNVIISGNKNEIDGFNFNNVSVFGDVNRTSYTGSSVFIFGNYNTANTENTLILNSSGSTILTGNNVSIIGVNNLTISGTNQDNTVHLPNVIIHSGLTLNGININQYWTASTGSNSLVRYPNSANLASGSHSIVVSGKFNSGRTAYSFIGNGNLNHINSDSYSTILNGKQNLISGASAYGTILNGSNNAITAGTNVVILGVSNLTAGTSNKLFTNSIFARSLTSSTNNLNIVVSNRGDFGVIPIIFSSSTGSESIIKYNDTVGNTASGERSIVAQGFNNVVNQKQGSIWNGNNNKIQTLSTLANSTILNGAYNTISGDSSTILGGQSNFINRNHGLILMGNNNKMYTTSGYNVIGGAANQNSGSTSLTFIGAGRSCFIHNSYYSFIGTGLQNKIYAAFNFIGSARQSQLGSYRYSTIITGKSNRALGIYDSIITGYNNLIAANSSVSTILNGKSNAINNSSNNSIIINGFNNAISGLTGAVILGITGLTASTSTSQNFETNLNNLRMYGAFHPKVVVVSSSTYTAKTDDNIILVDGSVAVTIFINSVPKNNQVLCIVDYKGSGSTNNITINCSGSGKLINGSSTYVINSNYGVVELIYNSTTDRFSVISKIT